MNFEKLFFDLIYVVLTVCVPIVVRYLVGFLKDKSQEMKSKANNEYISYVIDIVNGIVTKAVTETTQTYVETLKKNGEFTLEAQNEAFTMTANKIDALVNDGFKNIIQNIYGDYNQYMKTLIESTVADNKIYVH